MRYAISLAICLAALPALAAEHEEGISLHPPTSLQWKAGPPSLPKGAQIAVLEGDPGKEGPFVFRVKAPDGYRIPPHMHPKMERVTVISGTFNIGMGDKFDEKVTKAMPAGTYGYWEPGMKHFVWTKGETIVQFHGMGPWSIQYVNPADDPRTADKAGAADGSTVTGIVRLKGTVPPPQEWKLDEALRRNMGVEAYREEVWLVGAEAGLANCVITLKPRSSSAQVTAGPSTRVVMQKVGVRYVPRVLVVTPDTEIVLKNKASLCRGFQIIGNPRFDHAFNFLIREGTEERITVRGPDVCSVTCPIRPYARGFIVVVDTPHFAVTDAAGRFSVAGLRPGEYQVAVWHEVAGMLPTDAGPTEVIVPSSGEMQLSYSVKSPISN